MRKYLSVLVLAAMLFAVLFYASGCNKIKSAMDLVGVGDEAQDAAADGEKAQDVPDGQDGGGAESAVAVLKNRVLPERGVCHSFDIRREDLQDTYYATVNRTVQNDYNPMYAYGVVSALETDLTGDGAQDLLLVEVTKRGDVRIDAVTADGKQIGVYASDILADPSNRCYVYVFSGNGGTFVCETEGGIGGMMGRSVFGSNFRIFQVSADGKAQTAHTGSYTFAHGEETYRFDGEDVGEAGKREALDALGLYDEGILEGFPDGDAVDYTPVFSGGTYYEDDELGFHIRDYTDAQDRPEFNYEEDDSVTDEVIALLTGARGFYDEWVFSPARNYLDTDDSFQEKTGDSDYESTFYRVDHPTVRCVDDLLEVAEQYMTEEVARASFTDWEDADDNLRIFAAPRYTDRDGKLYVAFAEWGDAAGTLKFTTYRVSDDLYYLYADCYFGDESNACYAARLIRTDGGWVFGAPDFFYLFGYDSVNGTPVPKEN